MLRLTDPQRQLLLAYGRFAEFPAEEEPSPAALDMTEVAFQQARHELVAYSLLWLYDAPQNVLAMTDSYQQHAFLSYWGRTLLEQLKNLDEGKKSL